MAVQLDRPGVTAGFIETHEVFRIFPIMRLNRHWKEKWGSVTN